MLKGFYFETQTRSFELNINSYIFLMSMTYSTDTVIETVVKGVMLLVLCQSDILSANLKRYSNKLIRRSFIMQQDNDPKHTGPKQPRSSSRERSGRL